MTALKELKKFSKYHSDTSLSRLYLEINLMYCVMLICQSQVSNYVTTSILDGKQIGVTAIRPLAFHAGDLGSTLLSDNKWVALVT